MPHKKWSLGEIGGCFLFTFICIFGGLILAAFFAFLGKFTLLLAVVGGGIYLYQNRNKSNGA